MRSFIGIVLAALLSSGLLAQEPSPAPELPQAESPPAESPPAEPPLTEAPAIQEAPQSAPLEDAIPLALAPSRYDGVFGRNPFLIKTVAPTVAGPNFAENLELRGYYSVRGKETAVLKDRQTNKSVRVTTEEGADGLKLVRVNAGKKRSETTVEITKGSETHVFTFAQPTAGGAPPGAGNVPGVGTPNGVRSIPRPNPTVPTNMQGGASTSTERRVMVPPPNGGVPQPSYGGAGQAPTYQNPAQAQARPQPAPQPGVQPMGQPGTMLIQGGALPAGQVPSAVGRRRRILATPEPGAAVPQP
jgi:hypothetical protein